MHNKITKLLDHGLNVVVKNKNKEYQVFIPYKDEDGDYKCSGWYDSITEAKEGAVSCYGYTPEDLKEKAKNWQIVEYYRIPYKKFEVGEKVRILDSVKETEDWEEGKEYFPNMVGVIKEVYDEKVGLYYFVCKEGKPNYDWSIGAEYLAPYIEDKEVETIQIGNNTYNKKEVENALKNVKSLN